MSSAEIDTATAVYHYNDQGEKVGTLSSEPQSLHVVCLMEKSGRRHQHRRLMTFMTFYDSVGLKFNCNFDS